MTELWLQALKVGDLVIVKGLGLGRDGEAIEKVTAATSHRLVVGNREYKRTTGYPAVRGKYEIVCLSEPTTMELARVRAKNRRLMMIRRLRDTDWTSLSAEQLEACRDIVYPEKVGE